MPRISKVHTPVAQWVTEKQPAHRDAHVVGTLMRAALRQNFVHDELEYVEAEVVVRVLAGVVS